MSLVSPTSFPVPSQSAVLSSIPLPITSLAPVEPDLTPSTVISSAPVVPTTTSGGGGSGNGLQSSSLVNSASLYRKFHQWHIFCLKFYDVF